MESIALRTLRKNVKIPEIREGICNRFLDKVMPEPNTGCWIWTAYVDEAGYGRFNIGKESVEMRSHRVSFELFKGPLISGFHVCHKCDNKWCVNPDHLFLGTDADNMKDRDSKGRCQKGETHFRAKLKDWEVLLIREAHCKGFGVNKIARYFKMNSASISNITRKKSWKHI